MKTQLRLIGFSFFLVVLLNQESFGQCNATYAGLPYTQGFESWVEFCGNDISSPDSSWLNSSPDSLPTYNTPGWRRDDYALWNGAGGWYTPLAAVGNYSARFKTAGTSGSGSSDSGNLDLHINCSTANNNYGIKLSFYYINEGGSDYMDVNLSTDSGTTFTTIAQFTTTSGWTLDSVTFTSISPKTIIRFSGTSVFGENDGTDIGLDSITVLSIAPCQGKPTAGTIVESNSCSFIGDTLLLSGTTTSVGISFMWQQSSDNINWNTITGDTLSLVIVTPETSTYYRSIVTCTNSGLSDTTASELVNGVGEFYRTIPYTESFESWITRCAVYPDNLDVPDTGWINNPTSGNNSWRRNDEGVSAGWSGVGGGAGNYISTPYGNYSARFHAWDASSGSTGALDLYVNCNTVTGTKELSFYYLNPESLGSDSMNVYISTDGGNTFGPSLITCPGGTTSWTNFTVPITSDSPHTVISFVATSDDGSNDMWLDNVQVIPPCQGKPVAGNITIQVECSGGTLSLPGDLLGVSYAWQQSTDDINWSTIAGDTTRAIGVNPFNSTYYRAIVICNASGLSDTTTDIKINGASSFYRSVPYTQSFESWMTKCAIYPDSLDVPDTGWINNPSSGNDSWRRNDEGASADWNGVNSGNSNYVATSFGSYSADFHAYDASPGSTGALNLYVNCSTAAGLKELSFYYLNPEPLGRDSMNAYISTDGGNTFSPSLIMCRGGTTSWTNYTLPITSDSPQVIISFVGTSDDGNNDMWLDKVQVLTECDGKPVAGTIAVQPACPDLGNSLMLAGNSQANGLSYSWQQSDNGNSWSSIAGDTTASIIASPLNSTYYRAIVICTASGLSDTTASIQISGIGAFYRTIPYTESFESWMTRCAPYPDSLDVPDTGWVNNPAFGDDSWRRNDEGSSANWDGANGGTNNYVPTPYGSYSAAFNAYDAQSGSTGALNLYVNCSTFTGAKLLSFYYLNPESAGSDSMNVYVSTDGGNTFGPSLVSCPGGTTNWTNFILQIASDSPHTVISFVGTADDESNDMWLDNVQIFPPCQGKPVSGTIVSSSACPGIGDLLSLSGATSSSGLLFNWQQSNDNISWNTITGDTTSSITVVPATSMYYRSIVTCNESGLSDTTSGVQVSGIGAFYRNIPYTESFESWITRCAVYPDSLDVPDTGWINNPVSGNDSWRRNDEGSSAGWNGANNGSNKYVQTPYGSYSAAFNAYDAPSGSTGALNLYVNCSTVIGPKLLSFYYLNPESIGEDSMNVYISTDGGNTFSTSLVTCPGSTISWTNFVVQIASDSPHTVISFVGTSDDGSNDMWLDNVQILPIPPCQGKPVAGTIVSSSACPGIGDLLSLSGTTSSSGLLFSWQQSNDNISWNTITGDTTSSVTVIPATSTYYRSIVTCTNSGLSDTTASKQVSDIGAFYRSIPYTESFESWITRCAVYPDSLDVPDTGWINSPTSGDDSWRRNDEGASADWNGINAGVGNYVQTPYGSYSARFHAYDAVAGSTGTLDLYVNCSTVIGTKQVSFYYLNPEPSGEDSMNVYISTDGGNTFGSSLITCPGSTNGWTNFTTSLASDSPHVIIRFIATSDDGSNDMWLDNVQVLPPCIGKPVAGNIITQSQCTGETLQLSGNTLGTGISLAWQQSIVGLNWSSITGDTTTALNVNPINSTYYRAIIICSNSGLSDTSISVLVKGAEAFYRTLPYTEGFESWITKCAVYPDSLDVPDTGWINNPTGGNDSWRRNDEGGSANWGGLSSGVGSYVSTPYGNYTARFHSWDASRGSTGTLNLYINCSTSTGEKQLSFYYLNPESIGRDSMNVYVSTDGGNTFGQSLITCPGGTTSWTNFILPIISDSPQVVISFVATADDGTNDMWIANAQVIPSCEGKPTAGTISSKIACSGEVLQLPITSIGLSYAWQQSNDNINWSTLTGDTTSGINVNPLTSTYYRAIVLCNGSGLSDTSESITIPGGGAFYRNVPYVQDFESWMDRCSLVDVPDTGWINTPSTGNDSWRRDDQGDSADWNNPAGGEYYPASYHLNHSARFHAYNGNNGTTGSLDLYVNCSTVTGAKELSFYYINPESRGSDSMNVYLSTDGGSTFGSSLVTCPASITSWTNYTLPIATDSPHVVISFVGTADDGNDDMGIDYVQVVTACEGKPSAGSIVAQSSCSNVLKTLQLTGVSLASDLSYTWQQSADSINWSSTGADTSAINVNPFNSTYYRAIVTCDNSGLTDTTANAYISGSKSFFRNIPYTQNFNSWINLCGNDSASPDSGWVNSFPDSLLSDGIPAWRRDDYSLWGGSASSDWYSPPAAVGNYSARFHTANTSGPGYTASGNLDLLVNCSTPNNGINLSFYYINEAGSDSMAVYLSIDGGETFTTLGGYTTTPGWTLDSLSFVSNSPQTIIRFTGVAVFGLEGSDDIGLDDVQVTPLTPCDDKPMVGGAAANNTLSCGAGQRVILTLNGLVEEGSYSYQWQSSLDNINWVNVSGGNGATSPADTTGVIKATTFYRGIVTCTNSGLSDTSQSVKVQYLPNCYCPPQTATEDGDNIGNVTIKYDSAVILNNGIDSPAINPNLLGKGIPYIDYADTAGILIQLQQGLTYTISSALITNVSGANYPDTAYVFIDYNQDGLWEPAEQVWSAPYNLPTSNTPVPTTGTFSVPLTADTGLAELRIQMSYLSSVDTPCYNGSNTQGETEDYLVHIAPSKPSGIKPVDRSGNDIEIYPDPFNNQFTLYFSDMPPGNYNLLITNAIGQKVMEYNEYANGSPYKKIIDLRDRPAGVYFVSIMINGSNYIRKVIKVD